MIKKGTIGLTDEFPDDTKRYLLGTRKEYITKPEMIGWIRVLNLFSGTHRIIRFENDQQYYNALDKVNADHERVDYTYYRYWFKTIKELKNDEELFSVGNLILGWLSRSKSELKQELQKCQISATVLP